MYHAVMIVGHGKRRRFSPCKVLSGLVIPLCAAFSTEAEAVNYLNVNGYTCSAIGDIYQIINK